MVSLLLGLSECGYCNTCLQFVCLFVCLLSFNTGELSSLDQVMKLLTYIMEDPGSNFLLMHQLP